METKKKKVYLKRVEMYGMDEATFLKNVQQLYNDTLQASEKGANGVINYHYLATTLEYRQVLRYLTWYTWQAHPATTIGFGGNWFHPSCLVHGIGEDVEAWYAERLTLLKKIIRFYNVVRN